MPVIVKIRGPSVEPNRDFVSNDSACSLLYLMLLLKIPYVEPYPQSSSSTVLGSSR